MYTLKIVRAIKKMSVNEIKDFIFENYFKQIGFSKESSYYSSKRLKRKDLLFITKKFIENVADPHSTKEHSQSFLRKHKTSETIRNNQLPIKHF